MRFTQDTIEFGTRFIVSCEDTRTNSEAKQQLALVQLSVTPSQKVLWQIHFRYVLDQLRILEYFMKLPDV